MTEVWHAAWTTHGAWPPWDNRGDWQALADFYATLAEAGDHASVSRPLLPRYAPRDRPMMRLTPEQIAEAMRNLEEMATGDGSGGFADRIIGHHRILAAAILHRQAHVLIECDGEELQQIVGRIKSKLSSWMMQRAVAQSGVSVGATDETRPQPKAIWSDGFWRARLDTATAIEAARRFIAALR